MNVADVLLDILVVLIAAKVAAEVAERAGVPAVVGEIAAGLLIGPSALGIVGGEDEVLRVLGEIGVILLLLEVGLQMDLKELGSVGRASCLVAVVGAAGPLLMGTGVAMLTGEAARTALFVGGALTATSVGITARVFGDLRVLGSTESRTVLGAAVIDDVLGLVILTVVTRVAVGGSISVGTVLVIIAVAVGFLVLSGLVGGRLAPPVFDLVDRGARSAGTLVAVALAFALAFASLAQAARLAPIVGAFVAGLALARCRQAERIRRELTPVGHLFVPVFFLQIGIDANLGQFADTRVLGVAALLLIVAVIGKLISAVGAIGSSGDRLLIGFGMLPRGEVGLIFAGLGLRAGILGQDLYAALLLVVLVTTVVSPSLLRWRLQRIQAGRRPAPTSPRPAGGWLATADGSVELAGSPGDHLALRLALEASLLVAHGNRPGSRLLDWLGSGDQSALPWNREATALLLRVLAEGDVRSWRFLEVSGVLDRALPELAETVRRRQADPFELDPSNLLRWRLVEALRDVAGDDPVASAEHRRLEHPEWLVLAALILETAGHGSSPVEAARRLVKRLDLGAAAEQEVALLVGESSLLRAAAMRPGGLRGEAVLPIAIHLDRPERARALYLISLALGPLAPGERHRLDDLHALVQAALARSELTGRVARNTMERRRAEATRRVGNDSAAASRVLTAPVGYLLVTEPTDVARQSATLDPPPGRGRVRVAVSPAAGPPRVGLPAGGWLVEVVSRDRVGLLATVTAVLADAGLDVSEALLATWPDGVALESFRVHAAVPPSSGRLEAALEAVLGKPQAPEPAPGARVTFDDEASPWYTLCEVRAPDRPALLHAVAAAFATAGVDVHTARVTTTGGEAVDRFQVTDRSGSKLDGGLEAAVTDALAGRAVRKRQRGWRRSAARTGAEPRREDSGGGRHPPSPPAPDASPSPASPSGLSPTHAAPDQTGDAPAETHVPKP